MTNSKVFCSSNKNSERAALAILSVPACSDNSELALSFVIQS